MTGSVIDSGGDGPLIVFMHGVGSGKEGWRAQYDAVVDAGWRFMAIDAPGFGGQELPQQAGFAPHVEALLAQIDQTGAERAVLCGHSLGGMTAQEFYANHPDRVSGLVLSATSPAFGKSDGAFQKKFLQDRFEPFEQGMSMEQFARQFSSKLVGSAAQQSAIMEIETTMSRVSIAAYKLAMTTITGFDQRANLPNITVPVLAIAGQEDTNSPSPMMEKMAGYMADCTFVELAATGHMAPIENSRQFNHRLIAFLRKLS